MALLAILARVRRRLRALAAIEGGALAGALALGVLALGVALMRWRSGGFPAHPLRLGLAVVAAIGGGAAVSALRRISLERCARLADRQLGGHDRVLSALAFWRAGAGAGVGIGVGAGVAAPPNPFVTAAIADAVARGQACTPGAVAPFRRPRALPGLASATLLVVLAALIPLPARGSRPPPPGLPAAGTRPVAARVRLLGGALDPERERIAAAQRAAGALGDPELAALARELAATVAELAGPGLDRGAVLDRLAELQRRSDEAAAELASLREGMERAGQALQATAATRESGRALEAGDGARLEKALDDLAGQAGEASASDRNRIAGALDKAGERAHSATGSTAGDARPEGTAPSPASGAESQRFGSGDQLLAGAEPRGQKGDGDGDGEAAERQRRLARDEQPRAPSDPAAAPRPNAAHERRLQRLARELRDTAAACRANPESCRRRLKSQANQLPRMEDEVRSLGERQRLAETVRQLRERLRREGNGPGEHARDERRFMRSARGDGGRAHERLREQDPGGNPRADALTDDPDAVSDQGDDRDDGDGDGDGDGSPAGAGLAGSGADDDRAGEPTGAGEGANGDGIGSQKGDAPLGERGSMTTRGRAREAQVRNGAGPTRAQVIQSAARRGFAQSHYQGIYTDYQAAVEDSLDASAVPPGRRYVVRRYFQLIRPQSSRAAR